MLSGDRRPTLQPVRGVTNEPSLPNGMRRACSREAIRLKRRRHRGSSSSSIIEFLRVINVTIKSFIIYIRR